MFQLHSSLRERSGRRQPPAERSPVHPIEHTEYHKVLGEVQGTRYQLYVCVLAFVLSSLVLSSILVLFTTCSSQISPGTTADQNVTSPTYSTAQTGQSAPHKELLALSNR